MSITISNDGNPGRKSHWLVAVYQNGKRIRRFFATRAEAQHYANETRATLDRGGDLVAIEKALRLSAGSAYAVDVLVEHGLAYIRNSGALPFSPGTTIADGIQLCLAKQTRFGASLNTRMRTRASLNGFQKVFGQRTVVSITESEIESYLALMKNRRGEAGGARTCTKLRTLEYIKTVLRVIGIANPLASVRKPRPTNEERGGRFFNADQFIAIMTAARPNERGMLAMALIGGLRPWILERLPADCVDMVRRVIRIPTNHSTDRTAHHLETEYIHPENGRVIPGLPSVIWDWLRIYPFEPHPWGPMQKRIAGQIGFWIQDGCRNTAAVYYNQLHGMAATSALFYPLGGNLGIIHHHVSPVTRVEAERFYSVNPTDFLDLGPTLANT